MSSETASPATTAQSVTMKDFMTLTKFRLSVLVIVTTLVGYWLGRAGKDLDLALMFHTLLGSTMAAFGAAVFNQLMEIEPDKRMQRTADRPLPSRRMGPGTAFGVGWVLSAFALLHLGKKVNLEAAALCAATLGVYLFIYTPMKQQSAWNTIVGAVSGALPPLIGWAGAAGPALPTDDYFRLELVTSSGAIYLFTLLFLWQLPHFLAINWMYREEYLKGGFVMWANEDESGAKTSKLALLFSLCAMALMFLPPLAGDTSYAFLPFALAVNLALVWLSWKFFKVRDRASARKLFFFTLLYLPLLLVVTILFWKP